MTTHEAPPASITTNTAPLSQPALELNGFEHKFETVTGVRIHYVIGGNPNGETIVLLAGYPQSWFAWRKVMPLLSKQYSCHCPRSPWAR